MVASHNAHQRARHRTVATAGALTRAYRAVNVAVMRAHFAAALALGICFTAVSFGHAKDSAAPKIVRQRAVIAPNFDSSNLATPRTTNIRREFEQPVVVAAPRAVRVQREFGTSSRSSVFARDFDAAVLSNEQAARRGACVSTF